ncbi:MAG: hypothetical protein AAF639_03645 [Chloroflexota bacterium]
MKRVIKQSSIIILAACLTMLVSAFTPTNAHAQTDEITYGLVQDPANPLLITAVAYPNFTSGNVTMTTAQFTMLLPEGTDTVPGIPDAPTTGTFTNTTGTWSVLKLTPTLWDGIGQNGADLQGYDLYQVTLQNSPSITANTGDPIPLFSFALTADCTTLDVRVLVNDEAIQQAVSGIFGNVNNQMSMSVDNAASVDIYTGNHPTTAVLPCPLTQRRIHYGLVQDPNNPYLITAVAYPDFTSNDVTLTTAQFTVLLPEGTTTDPAVPDAPATGAFTDITGEWDTTKLTPSAWAGGGNSASDLEGYDLYQMSIRTSPEVTATAWVSIPLFSFTLPNDCSGTDLRILDNDEAIQQAILTGFGNANNQMSMSVDSDPSVDIYVDNHAPATMIACPLVAQTTNIAIDKTLNTPDPVLPGQTVTFTIRITNTGTATITTLPLTDTYTTAYLTYVGIRTSPESNTTGNTGQILWSDLTQAGSNGFGRDLGLGDFFEVVVEFVAASDTSLLPGTQTINTAQAMTQTTSAPIRVYAPTNVVLVNRTVTQDGDNVVLSWSTVNETEMIGFHVLRMEKFASGEISEPVRLTSDAELLLAHYAGKTNGSDYLYTDTTAEEGVNYHYVVEMVTADGTRMLMDMGVPREALSTWVIYLPILRK